MKVLAIAMVVIILQYIIIANQYIVQLRLMQYYMSTISQSWEKRNHGKDTKLK